MTKATYYIVLKDRQLVSLCRINQSINQSSQNMSTIGCHAFLVAYETTYRPMSPQHRLCSPSENE